MAQRAPLPEQALDAADPGGARLARRRSAPGVQRAAPGRQDQGQVRTAVQRILAGQVQRGRPTAAGGGAETVNDKYSLQARAYMDGAEEVIKSPHTARVFRDGVWHDYDLTPAV